MLRISVYLVGFILKRLFIIVWCLEFFSHFHLKHIFRYICNIVLHKVDTCASRPMYLYSGGGGTQHEFRPMCYYHREFFVLALRFTMKIAELRREVCNTRNTIQPQIMTFSFHSVLTTGWKVRGPNPGGGEVFHAHPDRP